MNRWIFYPWLTLHDVILAPAILGISYIMGHFIFDATNETIIILTPIFILAWLAVCIVSNVLRVREARKRMEDND